MIDPSTALAFSMFENKGVYALLLGSGVSRSAQIPTGWEITLDLVRRAARLEGAEEQLDWAAWHRSKFGEAPNYGKLLDALSATPDERRSIIHSYIEPTAEEYADGVKTPTRAHRAIAKLIRDGFVRVVITTNFDRLLETALRELGVEPTVVKSDDDLEGAVPLIHSRCFILKVHGDYLDTRLRNTEGELAGYSPALDRFLDRVLDEHGLVACGWSADWDEALRAAISRAPSRRYPLFWASRGTPSTVAQDLIAHRAGRVVQVDGADEFFEGLQSKIEVQGDLARPDPRSVDLLVAAAKRYLARPEHRIQLGELVAGEARRAADLVAEAGFTAQGSASQDEFIKRTQRYEAIFEPLCRVLFTLGRWGDAGEFGLATEILKRLGRPSRMDGSTILLGLMEYPAVLAWYAYGMGLAKADRLPELWRWLTTPLDRTNRHETPAIVENLFLWNWEHLADNRTWQWLPGQANHRSAQSHHLTSVLDGWLGKEFLGSDELELCQETFETFATLSYLSLTSSLETLTAASQTQDIKNLAAAPLGRITWHANHHRPVFEAIGGSDRKTAVTAAGFAQGNPAFLDLAVTNIRRLIGGSRFWG
jgi:hypothetical protein